MRDELPTIPVVDPRDVWRLGHRVRVDTLRPRAKFIAYDGRTYEYVRRDGGLSGAHVVVDSETNLYTHFAGCAEVVRC